MNKIIEKNQRTKLATCLREATTIDALSSSHSLKTKLLIPEKKKQRRRTLSGYNYFMKYHRAATVMDEPLLVTVASLSPSEKREHVISVLRNDPYRLDGKKRRHRKSHGVIGFKELTLQVASSWKNLDTESKSIFEDLAKENRRLQDENDDAIAVRKSPNDTCSVRPALKKSTDNTKLSSSALPAEIQAPDKQVSDVCLSHTCTGSSSNYCNPCEVNVSNEELVTFLSKLDWTLL